MCHGRCLSPPSLGPPLPAESAATRSAVPMEGFGRRTGYSLVLGKHSNQGVSQACSAENRVGTLANGRLYELLLQNAERPSATGGLLQDLEGNYAACQMEVTAFDTVSPRCLVEP